MTRSQVRERTEVALSDGHNLIEKQVGAFVSTPFLTGSVIP